MERRRLLTGISTVGITAIAGCSSDTSNSPANNNGSNEQSFEEEEPEYTAEEPWQEKMPHCSEVDAPIRVRGISGRTVSLENKGIEPREIYNVIVTGSEGGGGSTLVENSDAEVYVEGGETANLEFGGFEYGVDEEIEKIEVELFNEVEGKSACWGSE